MSEESDVITIEYNDGFLDKEKCLDAAAALAIAGLDMREAECAKEIYAHAVFYKLTGDDRFRMIDLQSDGDTRERQLLYDLIWAVF